MTYKMLATFFRLSLFIALTTSVTNAGAVSSKLQEFEYAIIATVIKHGLSNDGGSIVIDESTTGETVNLIDPGQTIETLAKELGTTPPALREWSRLNRGRYRLGQALALEGKYHLLANEERLEIFNGPDPDVNWQQFRARFPDAIGIIRVSRPSTDAMAKSALLYLEFECGSKCGSGRLINLVQAVPDQWQVTTGTLVWITSPD